MNDTEIFQATTGTLLVILLMLPLALLMSCTPDWNGLIAAAGPPARPTVFVAQCEADSITKITVYGGETGSVDDQLVWEVGEPENMQADQFEIVEVQLFNVPNGWRELVRRRDSLEPGVEYEVFFLTESNKDGSVKFSAKALSDLEPNDVIIGSFNNEGPVTSRSSYEEDTRAKC